MRKKLTKFIESCLPQLFDAEGEPVDKRKIANKILDSIPHADKLDVEPFTRWVPLACSTCYFNQGHRIGCVYDLVTETVHEQEKPPGNCPLGHK